MLSRRFRFVGTSLAGPRWKRFRSGPGIRLSPRRRPRASTAELTAADREALAHVTGLLRAYYQTLLIEPTPERLLGLLDEIDAAWKRRAAARS